MAGVKSVFEAQGVPCAISSHRISSMCLVLMLLLGMYCILTFPLRLWFRILYVTLHP